MKLDSLENLFVNELRDLYSAENHLTRALPRLEEGAASPELRAAFREHLAATEGHVRRLEQIFEQLGLEPGGVPCRAMLGLIEEGGRLLENGSADPVVRDAALIVAAQKVEHYEMAGYGSVREFARLLNQEAAAQMLQDTLDEEIAADQKLTELAEGVINVHAAAVEDDGAEPE